MRGNGTSEVVVPSGGGVLEVLGMVVPVEGEEGELETVGDVLGAVVAVLPPEELPPELPPDARSSNDVTCNGRKGLTACTTVREVCSFFAGFCLALKLHACETRVV